jgi:hypothetical protein
LFALILQEIFAPLVNRDAKVSHVCLEFVLSICAPARARCFRGTGVALHL